MSFHASGNEKSVFPAYKSAPVYKAAGASTAVLPPPQFLGMGQLPPQPLGLQPAKEFVAPPPLGSFINVKAYPQQENVSSEFPVFEGQPKNMFGHFTNDEPAELMSKVEQALEKSPGVDFQALDGAANAFRGRFFGDLNNAEFEVRVFAWNGYEGTAYVEFSRFYGDGWEFTNFVGQIMRILGKDMSARQLPPLPHGYEPALASPDDLRSMLSDVEEGYQDIAEQSAAELAMQTEKDICRQQCEEIDHFCARVLKIVEDSSNCAIVRSMLICLLNVVENDGSTKRMLNDQQHVLQSVAAKWAESQSMCGGLYQIAPSRQVTQQVNRLLMV
jgi:hypothetical protein